jgi:hypothetical protein
MRCGALKLYPTSQAEIIRCMDRTVALAGK